MKLVKRLHITATEPSDRFSAQQQQALVQFLRSYDRRPLRFCVTCGAHLKLIYQTGIRHALNPRLDVVPGPGNAAAIVATGYLERLRALARQPHTLVLADKALQRMPLADGSTLAQAAAAGASIECAGTPLDVVARAAACAAHGKQVVSAAYGFEPAAVAWGIAVRQAMAHGVTNLRLLTHLRTLPPLMDAVSKGDVVDGFLVPGHVAMVMGAKYFRHVAHINREPMAVAGFTREQLLLALCKLSHRAERLYAGVYNLYPEFVSEGGNPLAHALLGEVYAPAPGYSRGVGDVDASALLLAGPYAALDAGSADVELATDALADGEGAQLLRGAMLLEEAQPYTDEAAEHLDWTTFLQ